MENTSTHLRYLEHAVTSLVGECQEQVGDARCVAGALYAPSSKKDDSVFALIQGTDGDKAFQRTDRVWRRRLSPQNSIAAEAWADRRTSIEPSRMFPDDHICAHIPVGQGMLQIAFEQQAPHPKQTDIAKLITSNAFAPLERILDDVITRSADNIDTEFNVRAPYTPNGIVVYCDISGFKEISRRFGYARAQSTATAFCHEFLSGLSAKHDAKIIRFAGDGGWMATYFDPNDPASKQKATHNAMALAQDIKTSFSSFVRGQDHAFSDAKIRVIAEEGELFEYNPGRRSSEIIDISGPVFTYITEKDQTTPRNRDVITIGDELKQRLQNTLEI